MTRNKLTALAMDTVRIGFSLISTCSNYTGSVKLYKESVLAALRSLLEALSGLFCELARHQSGNEPTMEFFRDSARKPNTLTQVRQYLTSAMKILARIEQGEQGPFPLTAMYLKAQALMADLPGLAPLSRRRNDRSEEGEKRK